MPNRLAKIKNRWLDFVAPLDSWLYVILARNSWASHQAQKALKQSSRSKKPGASAWFSRATEKVMRPEGWSLALLWAVVIIALPQIIFLFGRVHMPWLTSPFQQPVPQSNPPQFEIDSVLMTAWQVLAAVIGLTFVIVIFLTQFVHERAFERRAFPLFVTHTWMIFTVIFGLLTMLSMGIAVLMIGNPVFIQDNLSDIAFYNFFLFSLNIILTIRLYVCTYQLVNPRSFRTIFLRYNRTQVSRSVESELLRRFAEQFVFERCRNLNIDVTFWHANHETGITSIKMNDLTSDSLEIIDINVGLLVLAYRRLNTLLRNNDTGRLEFVGLIRNRLSSDRPEIAFIPSVANRPQVVRLLQRAVRVQYVSEGVIAEDDLQLNRDLISDEIKAGRANGVAELLDQYLYTLRSFLEAIEAHGLRYSPQEAQKEDGFFSGWEIISKIQRHYYSLAEQALQSSDHDILYHFVSFPWKAMSLSLKLRDHLVFQRFADAHTYLYAMARRVITSDDRRRYVYEHSWRHLVEFYLYLIRPRLEDLGVAQSYAQTLGDYADNLILVLNRLLKLSLDYHDLEQFRNFSGSLRQIGTWSMNSPVDEIESLQIRLELSHDDTVRHTIEGNIARKHIVADQLLRIRKSRGICFLGLGGWLMHLFDAGALATDVFKDFIQVVSPEFTDIVSFTSLYSRVLNDSDAGKPFEWDHWEMNEQPEAYGAVTVNWVQSSNWVMKYYVYRALELSPHNVDSIPELAATSVSERLAEVVNTCLADFKASEVWRGFLIDPDAAAFEKRAMCLREMLARAARRQRALEEDELIGQPLNQERISDFIARIKKQWRQSAVLRSLITTLGRYEEKPESSAPADLVSLSIKQLDEKGAFVLQNRVNYLDWGDSYGRGLARGEDRELITAFATLPAAEAALAGFDGLITGALDDLRQRNLKPIILYNGWPVHRVLYELERFVPSWRGSVPQMNLSGVEGTFDEVLTIRVPSLESNNVIVVDPQEFGVLRQYKPDDNEQFPLCITVLEITPERAEELLQQQPDLAMDPKSKMRLSKEDAVRRLRQRVLVDVYERFRLEDINTLAGKRFSFLVVDETESPIVEEIVVKKEEAHNESPNDAQQVMTSTPHTDNSSRRRLLSTSVVVGLASAALVASVMIRRHRPK